MADEAVFGRNKNLTQKKEEKEEEVKEEKVAPAAEGVETPTESVGEEAPSVSEGEKVPAEVEEKVPETEEKPKKEAPAPKPKKEKPTPSGKHADLIKQIESMSVADLAELVKALEERFGVSAAAPAAAVASAAASGGAAATEAEEKSSYNIVLKDSGAQKIAVIKAVREINQELGLKEAKDLVEGAPKEIKKDVPRDEAEETKKKLEAAGATAELV